MLKGTTEVTLSDALKKAEKACGTTGLTHSDSNDEQGKMPSYIFTKDSITIAVTKYGGYLSYMLGDRKVSTRSLTALESVGKAKEYLTMLGINHITDTYYEISGNVCTVNFAGTENDIIMYTDLIKVSVAMDNGDILSFDGRGYITNHKKRNLSEPKITAEQARKKISTELTVTDTSIAVVPSAGTNELFCYEFHCTSPENRIYSLFCLFSCYQFLHSRKQDIHIDRLRNMVVHSRFYRIVLILGKRIGSERYYRYIGFFAVVYHAYLGCGLIAVHYRHLDIHKTTIRLLFRHLYYYPRSEALFCL